MILSTSNLKRKEQLEKQELNNQPEVEETTDNILADDIVIKGTVQYEGKMTLNGCIEGEIISNGDILVGDTAHIEGKVQVNNIILDGKIDGNVEAKDRCTVHSSAELIGDVVAGKFTLEEGAVFWGSTKIGIPSERPKKKTSQRAAKKAETESKEVTQVNRLKNVT